MTIKVREHIEDGTPNPEYLIFGELSDLKVPVSKTSGIINQFRAARKQGIHQIVINLKHIGIDDVKDQLIYGFRRYWSIDFVDLIYQDKVLRITRKDYQNRNIKIVLDGLK